MADVSFLNVNEIINSLKRSFIPTILIEGPDDVFIYRWLKKNLNANPISLQPCGGRINLFSIYDRKAEFDDKNIIFVADKDSYRFEGIPDDREEIIFTSGYSIENDIYEGSTISELIDDNDKPRHHLLREIIGKWFAFELQIYLGSPSDCSSLSVANHINVVSPIGLDCICPNFSEKINYIEPSTETIEIITNEYNLNVRGKQLFQMLSRFLSQPGRFSHFTDKNLIEIALKQGNNSLIERLIREMDSKLNSA